MNLRLPKIWILNYREILHFEVGFIQVLWRMYQGPRPPLHLVLIYRLNTSFRWKCKLFSFSSCFLQNRKALANALAVAPSMWTLGNAGMGALQVIWSKWTTIFILAPMSHDDQNWYRLFRLQRLAEDSNPAIAAAASRAIYELKKQWEIEEGDSWRFMVNQNIMKEGSQEADNDTDIIWGVQNILL